MNYAELMRDYGNDSDWRRYHEPLPQPRWKVRFVQADEPHLTMAGGSIRIKPDAPDQPGARSGQPGARPDQPSAWKVNPSRKAHALAMDIVDNITGDLPGPSRLYWLHKAPQIASMISETYDA